MDTTVQKCSGEVKQTPDCPLKRTQKTFCNRGVCLLRHNFMDTH